MALEDTFYDVVERTSSYLSRVRPDGNCDWYTCYGQYGKPQPPCSLPGIESDCLYGTAYDLAVREVLKDDEACIDFLAGCAVQSSLDFYACGHSELQGEDVPPLLNVIATAGRGFVFQKLGQSGTAFESAADDPLQGQMLTDFITDRAIEHCISHFVYAEQGATVVLQEEIADSLSLAIVIKQIGRSLPIVLAEQPDYEFIQEDLAQDVRREDGIVLPNNDTLGFGRDFLEHFIAARVRQDFPTGYNAFYKDYRMRQHQLYIDEIARSNEEDFGEY